MPRRFFYDCEFHERQKNGVWTIELISIGVVNENGRAEFYAESSEFDMEAAKQNDFLNRYVLPELFKKDDPFTNAQIAEYLFAFLQPSEDDPVQLYGYYADYDHVVTCWLWGQMVNLPKGMSFYTVDLKQISDQLGAPKYPSPKFEHHALADARWNRSLFNYLRVWATENDTKIIFP